MRQRCALVVALSLASASVASPLSAQGVSTAPVPTVARRPGPLNYMFRSFLLPGWGQASLDRKLTGGIFIAFEGLALGMALKAHREIPFLERTGDVRLEDKRNERQDWIVLVAFNHLMSGLEAFVSANLYDFPGDLSIRVLDGGRTGMGLSLPIGPK